MKTGAKRHPSHPDSSCPDPEAEEGASSLWTPFLTMVTLVSFILMLTTACSPPPRYYYPLAEPLSPAMTRADKPARYTGHQRDVSCSGSQCF